LEANNKLKSYLLKRISRWIDLFFRRELRRDWHKCANAATILEISPFGIFRWTLHSRVQIRTDVSDAQMRFLWHLSWRKGEICAKNMKKNIKKSFHASVMCFIFVIFTINEL